MKTIFSYFLLWFIVAGMSAFGLPASTMDEGSAASKEPPTLTSRCGQTAFDLCGYVNAKTPKKDPQPVFVIKPTFEVARKFSEGLAAVRVEGKYGYIGPSGDMVIAPRFDQASEFTEGLAIVGEAGALGIINRSGDYVVVPSFAEAEFFSDQIVLAVPFDSAKSVGRGTIGNVFEGAGLYHIKAGWLTPPKYKFERFGDFTDDLIWAVDPSAGKGTYGGLYGLMNIDGSWRVKPQYTYGSGFHYNWAIVRKIIDGKVMSGAIDREGNEVIPFDFEFLSHWDDQFLMAGTRDYADRKVSPVNQKGELLTDRYFDEIVRPDKALGPDHPKRDYFTVKDGDQWKSLLFDGTLTADQRIGSLYLNCDQFQIFYGVNGYELRPKNGALPTVWFERPQFPFTNQRCTPPPTLVRDNTYAELLEDGSIFAGFYSNSMGFFGPNLWVKVDGKWGLVDREGNAVVAPIYDEAELDEAFPQNQITQKVPSTETDKAYRVSIGDNDFLLRFNKGKYQQEDYFPPIEDRRELLQCRSGFTIVHRDGKWGMTDNSGHEVIPAQYRAISCYARGVALVPNDELRKWCPIDRYGKPGPASACVGQYYPIYLHHNSPEEFVEDPYENNVIWMQAWLEYGAGFRDRKPRLVSWYTSE